MEMNVPSTIFCAVNGIECIMGNIKLDIVN